MVHYSVQSTFFDKDQVSLMECGAVVNWVYNFEGTDLIGKKHK